jgi:hypothetical protein
MSNTIAVQTLDPIIEGNCEESDPNAQRDAVQKKATEVVPPNPSEPPTLDMLMQLYATQDRECWLCEGIARKIAESGEISEDDIWHFTSCVLSWEYLHSTDE